MCSSRRPALSGNDAQLAYVSQGSGARCRSGSIQGSAPHSFEASGSSIVALVSTAMPAIIAIGSSERLPSRRSAGCLPRRGTPARFRLARAYSRGCLTRAAADERRSGIGVNRSGLQAPLAAERERWADEDRADPDFQAMVQEVQKLVV